MYRLVCKGVRECQKRHNTARCKSAVTHVSSEKALQPRVLQHCAAHPALDAVASGLVAGLTPKRFDSPSRIIPGGSRE